VNKKLLLPGVPSLTSTKFRDLGILFQTSLKQLRNRNLCSSWQSHNSGVAVLEEPLQEENEKRRQTCRAASVYAVMELYSVQSSDAFSREDALVENGIIVRRLIRCGLSSQRFAVLDLLQNDAYSSIRCIRSIRSEAH